MLAGELSSWNHVPLQRTSRSPLGAGPAYSHSLFSWKRKFLFCSCTPLVALNGYHSPVTHVALAPSPGPCPTFPAAWWVFHTHPKLHVYTELFTNCYLLTPLSVNDHCPPSWRHMCLFCLFHSLSNQSLCPIDFPCSHQKDLFTHRQTHLALSHC